MEFKPKLDHGAEAPLYRQLSEQIAQQIRSGLLARGERLPATRELAGLLGLNRTTVSAAYEILESEGLISGQVGRGSFVTGGAGPAGGVDWNGLLERSDTSIAGPNGGWSKDVISFAVSRPSRDLFPLDEFRATCATVLARRDLADILQLGSPSGYEPLRRYLMEEARRQQVAGPGDDLLITNGCQQALDLIGRVLLRPGDTVAVEDPLYTGLKNLLTGMGAQLCGVPVGADGMDAVQLERVLEREKPRFLVVTSNFQNPTGASLPLAGRKALLGCGAQGECPGDRKRRLWRVALQRRAAARAEATGREWRNGAAAELLQSQLPRTAGRLGGGAETADRPFAACQGSGGSAYRSALAGGAAGICRIGPAGGASRAHAPGGSERLAATLEACAKYLPAGTRWTRPEGGMNVWVRLPEPLDAGELLARAQREGVAYMPGRYFAVSRLEPGALRLSFAGLTPEQIRAGLAILGRTDRGRVGECGAELRAFARDGV